MDAFLGSDEDDDDNGPIDIVELPPERVDEVPDNEDIDDNIIDDDEPADVPGPVEIHCAAREDDHVTVAIRHHQQAPLQMIQAYHLPKGEWRESPLQCFEKLFDDTIITDIVRQTVTYATQKKNVHQFSLSSDCIRKFIDILLFTGYHSLPQEQLYWCEDEDMDVQSVRKCMSRNRYLEIKRYLHVTDNSDLEGIPENERDKLFKIRPLIDKLNKNFQQFGVFSESLSIDEQMVRYFGHHHLKQFMHGKPVRFGFKQWPICCSQTGYCYQMQVYEGKTTGSNDDAGVSGLGASVVLKMISILETPYAHKIYFDSFFTGFSLMRYLKVIDVRATGTARFNRMNKCPIAPDKEMKKKERGTCDYRFDSENEILGVIWNDSSCVKLLSNHGPIDPMSQVKRCSRENKREIQVPQPKLITEYNRHMGGVDKMDWNVQKYRIKVGGKSGISLC
ncbi:piggyBac transposable element-derived protein 3-like [Polypterus senegalus]|uniref:piggyBac transposable element-derived protein 3-like n=1 Tax=Polypterus senegalus TaxID=55291 RepID=UPI0019669C3E|nr:piggyBac transposable element-derived protein 3-like [Polypterus senegalus]